MTKFNGGSLQLSNDAKLAHDRKIPGGQDKERKEENKKHHPEEPQKPYKNPDPELR